MKLIAHRGYWEEKHQQNTYEAILLGLIYSDGVEIDLRLYRDKIIITHDSWLSSNPPLYLEEVLPLSKEFPLKLWALNIKEDGLSSHLKMTLNHYPLLKYFCFDMSFPETYIYIQKNINIASRISDLEKENNFISKNSVFYIHDSFKKLKKIKTSYRKQVMFISPELHKNPFNDREIQNIINHKSMHFLCTDRIADLC